MIFNGIISLLIGVFSWILSLPIFPVADIETINNIHTSFQNFGEYMYGFNWIFPVQEFLIMLSVLILLSGTILLVKLTRWVLSILTGGLFK